MCPFRGGIILILNKPLNSKWSYWIYGNKHFCSHGHLGLIHTGYCIATTQMGLLHNLDSIEKKTEHMV